jgi:hypothetical protein
MYNSKEYQKIIDTSVLFSSKRCNSWLWVFNWQHIWNRKKIFKHSYWKLSKYCNFNLKELFFASLIYKLVKTLSRLIHSQLIKVHLIENRGKLIGGPFNNWIYFRLKIESKCLTNQIIWKSVIFSLAQLFGHFWVKCVNAEKCQKKTSKQLLIYPDLTWPHY